MDTEEQLRREYSELLEKYGQNHQKVSAVQKRWYEIQGGGTIRE
jgi:hypothetical protein